MPDQDDFTVEAYGTVEPPPEPADEPDGPDGPDEPDDGEDD
jgi:hypothetical protein